MNKTYCIFSAYYLPNIGGIEKFTESIAKSLADDDDRVIIVTSNAFGEPSHERLSKRVEIIRLPVFNFIHGRFPLPKYNSEYRKLSKWLDNASIDYVVINARFYPHSVKGLRFAKKHKIRPIVIDHGSAHLTLGHKMLDAFVEFYEHFITKYIKSFPADFYAVSELSSQWLKHFGINSKGIISNSIDAKSFRESSSLKSFRHLLNLTENDFIISYVGRLIPEKGIHHLLEAANNLSNEKQLQFLIAGDGSESETLEHNSTSNTHFLGRISSNDVSALLQDSNVYCLPSRSEGFATALLESGACGTPFISTKVGGAVDLVLNKDYGILLDHLNAVEISLAILELYRNPDRCALMGKNVQALIEKSFTWETATSNLKKACELANNHHRTNQLSKN